MLFPFCWDHPAARLDSLALECHFPVELWAFGHLPLTSTTMDNSERVRCLRRLRTQLLYTNSVVLTSRMPNENLSLPSHPKQALVCVCSSATAEVEKSQQENRKARTKISRLTQLDG